MPAKMILDCKVCGNSQAITNSLLSETRIAIMRDSLESPTSTIIVECCEDCHTIIENGMRDLLDKSFKGSIVER